MKPPFDIAADLDTPVSAYLKLAPLQPRFLLESVEGGERMGRYSFIGFGEGLDVRLDRRGFHLGEESFERPEDGAGLLRGLRKALTRAPELRVENGPSPFAGGLVGVSAYDMVRYFESRKLGGTAKGDEPEALYFAPRSMLVFDHLSRRAALLHAGDADERLALRREVKRALAGKLPSLAAPKGHEPPRGSFGKQAFEDAVRRAQQEIRAGEVYQLVLSVRFAGRHDLSPFQVYRALRLLNPSPYMYFCQFGGKTVIGSSPEALVGLDRRRARLRPIAGTRPRGAGEEEDLRLEQELLDDPKEAAEHVMLVDLARNDLGRVAVPGSIAVRPSRAIERYSHVMHLVSGVEGVLASGADAFDLFAATFPAGTVVGAPKVRAMELIDEIEPVGRGFYAGTVGYFGHQGAMDQAITIRTLVLDGEGYTYQAGAGIVADSVPEREYEEVLAKSGVLAQALRLAEEEL